jgi:hypothetical protein
MAWRDAGAAGALSGAGHDYRGGQQAKPEGRSAGTGFRKEAIDMRARIAALPGGMAVFGVAVVYFSQTEGHLRGDTLIANLEPLVGGADLDKALVAKALIGNYTQTRQIAAFWSGLYWGFAWAAPVLGALSGLILKLESFIPDEKAKKDIAALFTVSAAIMITVSTGGEFQRKWQANRAAAASIERLGYEFLSKQEGNPRQYLGKLGDILLQRHLSILGTSEKQAEAQEPSASRPK